MEDLEYDWRKHASQMVSDDDQVERAFMDQAYQFIANKGRALMKDPYRLGFEIVHKNDTNTRMVGIFAFRVGNTLIYVPVFFLNGEIKGTDLMYRHDAKLFNPFEEQWIKYIISKSTREMGRGVSKSPDNRTPKDINLESIAYPPGSYSGAKSASETPQAVKYASEILEGMKANPGSLLRKFIVEDGGYDAIYKLAALMDRNYNFAETFARNIPMDCLMPPELPAKTEKKASAPEPVLVLSVGGIDQLAGIPEKDMAKAAANMSKRGYNLWDDRDSGDARMTKPVYTDASTELSEIGNGAGFYKVLMSDGSTRRAFVAHRSPVDLGSNRDSSECPSAYPHDIWEDSKSRPKSMVFEDGSAIERWRNGAYGEVDKCQAESLDELEETMQQGSCYMVFDAEAGTLSEPVMVTGKTRKGGIEHFKAVNRYGEELSMHRNPDAKDTKFSAGVLGSSAYFIKVKKEAAPETCCDSPEKSKRFRLKSPDTNPGSGTALREWCLGNGIKSATLYHRNGDYHVRHGFRDQSPHLNRPSMAVKLAMDLGIHADAAEELLDSAEESGAIDFLYGDPEIQEKSAAMTMLVDQPRFNKQHDSTFNVDTELPQRFVLGTRTIQDEPVLQNVGDAYDPGMGTRGNQDGNGLPLEQLMNSSPEQLAQLAMGDDSPQIFEHGLIGTLTQTYDSVAMIDKYLPDMEQALDKQGRLLFLFYWKPRDFENAYGADDMNNLESQILSNFRSFGELVLELLKKSDGRRNGNVSLAGD